MSNDNKVKIGIRQMILNHINKFKDCDRNDDLMSGIIGIQIDSKEDEVKEDILICEDEVGTTARRLREDSYIILDVDPDWIDENWWKTNSLVSLEEATLAIAYDYLLQENLAEIREFTDEKEAMNYVYDVLNKLDKKDFFTERLIDLILDFYPDLRKYS